MISPIKAYTFASRTSPYTNQSLQKSMLSTTLRKNKKSSPLNKNKTLPKRNPAGESRMTELIDNNKGKSLEKKEGQLVTANKLKQGCVLRKTGKWYIRSSVLRRKFSGKMPCLRLFANRYASPQKTTV